MGLPHSFYLSFIPLSFQPLFLHFRKEVVQLSSIFLPEAPCPVLLASMRLYQVYHILCLALVAVLVDAQSQNTTFVTEEIAKISSCGVRSNLLSSGTLIRQNWPGIDELLVTHCSCCRMLHPEYYMPVREWRIDQNNCRLYDGKLHDSWGFGWVADFLTTDLNTNFLRPV